MAISEELPGAPEAPHYSSSAWPVLLVRPVRRRSPIEQRPHLIDDALYVGIGTYRTLDYLSTEDALAHGAHEVILPLWVVNNSANFIAFEGLATLTEVAGAVWLIRRGHRRMARVANGVSIGLGLQSVVHNYTEPYGSFVARP